MRRISLCSLRSSTSVARIEIGDSPRRASPASRCVSQLSIGRIAERPATIASSMLAACGPRRTTAPARVMTRASSRRRQACRMCRASPACLPHAGSSSSRVGAAQHDAAVRAAEAERIGQRHRARVRSARRAEHEVQVAVGIGLALVRVHRHLAAIDRQRAHRDLDGAGGGDQVAHRALRRADTRPRFASSPNTAWIAALSLRSFIRVDVPCALM